ncbi:hypothetical protein BgiBS90_001839, partial [Biomphalaria glabrata]
MADKPRDDFTQVLTLKSILDVLQALEVKRTFTNLMKGLYRVFRNELALDSPQTKKRPIRRHVKESLEVEVNA